MEKVKFSKAFQILKEQIITEICSELGCNRYGFENRMYGVVAITPIEKKFITSVFAKHGVEVVFEEVEEDEE